MTDHTAQDPSTYGALFALFSLFVVFVAVAYFALRQIYLEEVTLEQQTGQDFVVHGIESSVRAPGEQFVRYEHLTSEEADQLIKQILESGASNEERIEALESVISE